MLVCRLFKLNFQLFHFASVIGFFSIALGNLCYWKCARKCLFYQSTAVYFWMNSSLKNFSMNMTSCCKVNFCTLYFYMCAPVRLFFQEFVPPPSKLKWVNVSSSFPYKTAFWLKIFNIHTVRSNLVVAVK